MSRPDLSETKRREEEKRESSWDSAARWRVLQDTITWAEAQRTVRRNDPAVRRAEERGKLAALKREHGKAHP